MNASLVVVKWPDDAMPAARNCLVQLAREHPATRRCTGDDIANGLAIAADGGDVITGSFQGAASFGSYSFTSKGGNDAFLVRLTP